MKNRFSKLRTVSTIVVVALVSIGLAFHSGTGTPSAWGILDISAICPLGAIESFLASKTFVPRAFIALAIMVVLVIIFGRAWCAWGCPVPLLRKVFGGKKKRLADGEPVPKAVPNAVSKAVSREENDVKFSPAGAKARGGIHDSRNWVLGGTLISTAVFGFPVFCLVCPVGLTFASLITVWRLFQFNEATWSLLVFPAVLILELVVLRKWCSRICPISALLSFISKANRTFRPHVTAETCLHDTGASTCELCKGVCPEGIDLHDVGESAPLSECTKCGACSDICPVQAIKFPFLSKKASGETGADEELISQTVQ